MTPYLHLLLNRKRNDPTIPYDDPNDPGIEQSVDERLPNNGSPIAPPATIPLRSIPRLPVTTETPPPAPIPLARQTAIATADPETSYSTPRLPVTNESPPELPATVKLGARVAQDQRDVATAQSHHHSKARDILEGLGQYVGSGIGLNVHKLIYPRGTETEKAQRQLATDVGLQKVATDNADTQSTIALRSAQARKIQADLDNPNTSDEDKRKLILAQEILRSHPQPFDPNDPADVVAMKKLNDAGIPIPKSYGKVPKPTAPHEPLLKERKKADGSTVTMQSDDYGKTWAEVPALASEAPTKETVDEVPDTTAPWLKEETDQREIARNANKSAAEARQSVLDYVAQNPNVDQKNDPRILSALASAKRLDETESEANKKAGEAHTKRIEAANKDAENRAKVKKSKSSSGLTIQGAIDHFKTMNKRAPTSDEIVNMQGALDAMP